VQDRDIVTIER